VARNRRLTIALGRRLLQSKLDVLTGAGGRRPGAALTILTGGAPEPRPARPTGPRRRFTPRTVYLSDRHLRDLDAILEVLQPAGGRRLTRSAVLRQAIEHLRTAVDEGAEPTLECHEHV
jgi:hypothetical protein